jgi:hypothetical protein
MWSSAELSRFSKEELSHLCVDAWHPSDYGLQAAEVRVLDASVRSSEVC